jgi:hypothetical protein
MIIPYIMEKICSKPPTSLYCHWPLDHHIPIPCASAQARRKSKSRRRTAFCGGGAWDDGCVGMWRDGDGDEKRTQRVT